MKKFLALALVLLLSFSLISCGGQEAEEAPAPEATEEEAVEEEVEEEAVEEEAEEAAEEVVADEETLIVDTEEVDRDSLKEITIGLVTDTGGIDDKSFNQGSWEGVKYYAEKFELPEGNIGYLQSTSDADYIPNLAQYSEDKKDLIVAAGFLFEESLIKISEDFPEQKILFIDAVVDAPNVLNALFAEHEGSYLVGVAAALKAQDAGQDTVGFVGGMDFDTIQKFEAGFEQGVLSVDPEMNIVVEYVGDFSAPEDGQTLAAKMYDSGVYVIYHAAGGSGNGVIKEAKDRVQNGEDVWVIGVDKDQFSEGVYADGKSVILTSMLKGVGQASYDASKQVAQDKFEGGTRIYDLKANGVGIPLVNPNLKDEWVEQINEFADKIINGEIEVDPVPTRVQ